MKHCLNLFKFIVTDYPLNLIYAKLVDNILCLSLTTVKLSNNKFREYDSIYPMMWKYQCPISICGYPDLTCEESNHDNIDAKAIFLLRLSFFKCLNIFIYKVNM